LPKTPVVITPEQGIGKYGGTMGTAVATRFLAINSALAGRFVDAGPFTWDKNATNLRPNWVESAQMSPDAKTFTVKIREGVKFSDGKPFTTDDLLFGYEDIGFNAEINSKGPPAWLNGVKFQKVDQYTLVFNLPGPAPLFIYSFQAGALGLGAANQPVVAKHYFQQFHPKYTNPTAIANAVKAAGVATWPELFILKAQNDNVDMPTLHMWRTTESNAERTIAERNPYYWKVDTAGNQLPYMDAMRFDVAGDGNVVSMRGMAGDLDLQFYNLSFGNYPTLKAGEAKGGYRIVNFRSMQAQQALNFNQNYTADPDIGAVLAMPDFRKALSVAINRNEINELVFLGQGSVGPLAPSRGAPDFDERYTKMYSEYNPTQAKQMLDAAVIRDRNGDGWRETPTGKPLTIQLISQPDLPDHVASSELVKGYWEAVGIKVNYETFPIDRMEQKTAASDYQVYMNKIDLIIYPLWFNVEEGVMGRWGNPAENIARKWEDDLRSGGKAGEKPSAEYQALYDLFTQALATTDEAKRAQLTKQMWDNYYKNLWNIGLVNEVPFPLLFKNTLKNVPESAANAWPIRTPTNAGMEQWWLDK
jgi:peptide/nickel transport system substrate-binding protein